MSDYDRECTACHAVLPLIEFFNNRGRRRYVLTDLCHTCHDTLYDIVRKSAFENWIERTVYSNNKRALDYGLVADLTAQQWTAILLQSDGYCHYCHVCVGIEYLILEHKVPLARQGGTTQSNVVAACNACNRSKGRKTIEQWRAG